MEPRDSAQVRVDYLLRVTYAHVIVWAPQHVCAAQGVLGGARRADRRGLPCRPIAVPAAGPPPGPPKLTPSGSIASREPPAVHPHVPASVTAAKIAAVGHIVRHRGQAVQQPINASTRQAIVAKRARGPAWGAGPAGLASKNPADAGGRTVPRPPAEDLSPGPRANCLHTSRRRLSPPRRQESSAGPTPVRGVRFRPRRREASGAKRDCPLWFSPPENRRADRGRPDSGGLQEDQAAGQAADQLRRPPGWIATAARRPLPAGRPTAGPPRLPPVDRPSRESASDKRPVPRQPTNRRRALGRPATSRARPPPAPWPCRSDIARVARH